MANFTHQQYVNYFRMVAESHVDISHSATQSHFARMNINDIVGQIRSDIHFPALILENYEGGFDVASDDQIYDVPKGGFMILGLAEKGDYASEDDVCDQMKAIGLDIISKIREDRKQFDWLRRFDVSKVRYYRVGPLFDRSFGYLFEFEIKTQVSLKYNPDKWL